MTPAALSRKKIIFCTPFGEITWEWVQKKSEWQAIDSRARTREHLKDVLIGVANGRFFYFPNHSNVENIFLSQAKFLYQTTVVGYYSTIDYAIKFIYLFLISLLQFSANTHSCVPIAAIHDVDILQLRNSSIAWRRWRNSRDWRQFLGHTERWESNFFGDESGKAGLMGKWLVNALTGEDVNTKDAWLIKIISRRESLLSFSPAFQAPLNLFFMFRILRLPLQLSGRFISRDFLCGGWQGEGSWLTLK